MVQSYMGISPDCEPAGKVKKMFWEKDVWVEKIFFRIQPPDGLGGRISKMEVWCRERYGSPRLNGPWFKASSYIIMDEKTYVFWKLCE